jgi:MYXO-CTERM domain-containing protein
MMRFSTRLVIFLFIVACGARSAGAAIVPADPSNYRTLIPTLQPGDTLDLAAGDYPDGLPITDLVGTASDPIVITGPETGVPAVLLGNGSRNTVSIRRSAYVTIRHLTLDGLLIDYVDAIKLEGDVDNWGHHITIEHCTIVNHDPNQQTVGISTKAPAWDWVIRYNVIHSAGTGLYLGNSNGEAPFVRGLIEFNLVADPEGYCMQIKHQNPRPQLAGMPPDGSVTIVRHNVFIKDDDPSGDGDRPNVLIGHLPLSGDGQSDHYELYGNFFFHNPREALFQGEGNLHLHDNVFVDAGAGWPAVNIRTHNDAPREVWVYNNTVYGADTGIAVTGVNTGFTQAVLGNAIFASSPLNLDGTVQQSDNVTDTVANAGTHVVSPSLDLATMDFFPVAGQLTGAAMDTALVSADVDHDLDFNGTVKDFTYRGAYHGGMADNPGWDLEESIKDETTTSPGPDAGPTPDGGGETPDGGTATDASVSTPDGGTDTDPGGGCGCHAGVEANAPLPLLLFGMLLVGRWRRRRRSRSR